MCEWCAYKENKWLLYKSLHWSVYLADVQDYVGRCILVLNRHCGSLSELNISEWIEYSKYNLLDVVKKGDIIFEANGGFGITGHVAIVEGIYSRGDGTNYIRLIEAIDVGVVRSILDDTRVDDKAVTILRVSSATATNISTAVSFCKGELGADYSLDFAKDVHPSLKMSVRVNELHLAS